MVTAARVGAGRAWAEWHPQDWTTSMLSITLRAVLVLLCQRSWRASSTDVSAIRELMRNVTMPTHVKEGELVLDLAVDGETASIHVDLAVSPVERGLLYCQDFGIDLWGDDCMTLVAALEAHHRRARLQHGLQPLPRMEAPEVFGPADATAVGPLSPPSVAGAANQIDGVINVTVILTVYRREHLESQLASLAAQQPGPPARVLIVRSERHTAMPPLEEIRATFGSQRRSTPAPEKRGSGSSRSGSAAPPYLPSIELVEESGNIFKFFGRFALALLAPTAFVCILDDDKVWREPARPCQERQSKIGVRGDAFQAARLTLPRERRRDTDRGRRCCGWLRWPAVGRAQCVPHGSRAVWWRPRRPWPRGRLSSRASRGRLYCSLVSNRREESINNPTS